MPRAHLTTANASQHTHTQLRDHPEDVWRLMEEVPKAGLLDMFRTFTQHLLNQH